MSRPRRGKIAQLPLELRNELCRRLLDGQQSPELLPWLNGYPIVKALLDAKFGGAQINDQNLTEWRQGGFIDWQADQERLDQIREISNFASQAAQSGTNIADGAAAVAAGRLIAAIDGADDDQLVKLSSAIAALQSGSQRDRELALKKRGIDQRDRALNLTEVQIRTRSAELFLAWYADKRATEIAASDAPKENKVKRLLEYMERQEQG